MAVPFPLAALPPWLRAMVEATARSAQADVGMTAVASLGILSAAVGRKGVVVLGRRRSFPVHLWVMVVGPPGDGKSEVFRQLSEPLHEVQRGEGDPEVAPAQGPQRSRYDYIRDPNRYAKAGSDDITPAELAGAVSDARRAVHSARAGDPVLVLADDITPTALVEDSGANATGSALISAEGGFDAWLAQGGAVARQAASSLNKAYDGVSFTRRRLRAPRIAVERPALTLLVGVQPGVFEAFAHERTLRRSGFTLRFLFARATARRQDYLDDPTETEVPDGIRTTFQAQVCRLIALPGWPPNDPIRLQVSAEGARLNAEFMRGIQSRIHDDGDARVEEYGPRLGANLPRIAGLLHLARNVVVPGDGAVDRPVDEETMAAAVQIATYLLEQGLAALSPEQSEGPRFSLVDAVERLLRDPPSWAGSPDELVAALERVTTTANRAEWPRGVNNLMRALRARGAELAARGVTMSEDRTSSTRMVFLSRREPTPES